MLSYLVMASPYSSPPMTMWENAIATYKKSLTTKDLQQLQVPTSPQDLVAYIAGWEQKRKKSKYTKIAAVLQACTSRIERFSAVIDQLAQGCPQPACLLWGSIKFVLTVSSSAGSSYVNISFLDFLPSPRVDHSL